MSIVCRVRIDLAPCGPVDESEVDEAANKVREACVAAGFEAEPMTSPDEGEFEFLVK